MHIHATHMEGYAVIGVIFGALYFFSVSLLYRHLIWLARELFRHPEGGMVHVARGTFGVARDRRSYSAADLRRCRSCFDSQGP